jgi:hypothetical protein
MSVLIVPTIALVAILNEVLDHPNYQLKLYSNNVTPDTTTTNASFTEVSGGGYAAIPLTFADWVITGTLASYPQQTFTFTGPTDGPGTIYGYYIVDTDNVDFIWAQRLPDTILPFEPINGSTGKITPVIEAES